MLRVQTPIRLHLGLICLAQLFFAPGLALAQTSAVPARSVPLLLPSAIAYDAAGNLYIAERQRHSVRKVDALANLSALAGTGTQGFAGDTGPAISAELDSPQGIAVDPAGDVFIADSGNHRIRRVDANTGTIRTIAGNGVAGFGGDGAAALDASFNLPRAICLDATGTNLYVADSRNHRIRHINLTTNRIDTIAGSGTQGFSGDGFPATIASLDSPDSIALDSNGNLYLADTHNQRIRRVATGTGIITTVAGTGALGLASPGAPASSAPLALPRGLTVDAAGSLYVADSGNHRILRIDPSSGRISVVAGSAVEGYSGDGNPAIAAGLDSPHSVTLSPAGLVTIADTQNQRVRQLLAGPAPSTPIQTIAGLGEIVPGIFTLTAPAVISYGSGQLIATLNTSLPASGQVTFIEVTSAAASALGTSPLAANSAVLSLSTIPAGQHRFQATYAGDAEHGPAQTATVLLTVSPLALVAAPASLSTVYGTPLPALSGSLTGLLAQDAARVTASFSTAASLTSPVGSYPITATLSGPAAADYTLQTNPAQVVITQANSISALSSPAAAGSFNGSLQLQVSSSTSGTPTGVATLLDNGALLEKANLSSAGYASFTSLNLSVGAHTLTATYSGDANFLPSSSAPLIESISPAVTPDFSLAATGVTAQTLSAGATVNYTVSLQMTGGGPPGSIALSVSGLPPFTEAAFNPGYIPPGATAPVTATMTVTSQASPTAASSNRSWSTLALTASLLPLGFLFHRRRETRHPLPRLALAIPLFACLSIITGCGDRIYAPSQPGSSTLTYTLTITGTATVASGATLQHAANVTLNMVTTQ